ncbi:helix-turn-helix domain-containing protein [Cytobacillus sp. FSL M8-0252]|uniref:helix-turn-helix domain-containing protein n=1 Tax=Cytobacillus sp. FSL M8-0252 TaxID=2921621 RepID=UPI0030FA0E3E
MSDNENTFGKYLREYREVNGLSISDLHRITGVSQPYLSQLENGTKSPSRKVIHRIAAGLTDSLDTETTFGTMYKILLEKAGFNTEWDYLNEIEDKYKTQINEGEKQVDLIEQSKELYKNEISIPIYLNKDNEGNFYFFKDSELIDDDTQQKLRNIIKTLLE